MCRYICLRRAVLRARAREYVHFPCNRNGTLSSVDALHSCVWVDERVCSRECVCLCLTEWNVGRVPHTCERHIGRVVLRACATQKSLNRGLEHMCVCVCAPVNACACYVKIVMCSVRMFREETSSFFTVLFRLFSGFACCSIRSRQQPIQIDTHRDFRAWKYKKFICRWHYVDRTKWHTHTHSHSQYGRMAKHSIHAQTHTQAHSL